MTAPAVEMTAVGDGLGVTLTHGPSAARIGTQPPRDNGGTGAAFSPTDLVGAALLSCALTTMALVAAREGVPWGEAAGRVAKRMSAAPRRIAELEVEIRLPRELPPGERARFEEIARTCPVARSLHPDLALPMRFVHP